MCGFYGSTAGYSLGRQALVHRGPDGYGIFRDGPVVVEHWRLSIIDLSTNGAQPMAINPTVRADGATAPAFVMAYNGEVYNFKELKQEFADEEFHSATDTEVVLRLYARHGLDCLKKLNGMFALAIYDNARQQIVLARDRFGIKPLYYHIDSNANLSFASELKALISNPVIERTLDLAAIQSLFHLLYIEGERTPFESVRKLPPASFLVYDLRKKNIRTGKFHQTAFVEHRTPVAACIDRIDELLAESIRMHLISDVPVGALLSGGVDSSLMVAMMRRYTDEIHTFSVGYGDDKSFDESQYFNRVAALYRTDHHHTVLHQSGIGALVENVCAVLDEPIADTSVFLNYFIFGFTAQSVKVCLSGLGGDELFGGYSRYLACQLLPIYTCLPAAFRQGIASLIEALPSSRHGRLGNKVRLIKTFLSRADPDLGRSYCNFIDYFGQPDSLPVLAAEPFEHSRFDAYWDEVLIEQMNRIFKFDVENYMVNDLLFLTDRMSMRHSLEARVPYLENNLVDFALGIAPGQKIKGLTLKYVLKRVAERYIPRSVIYRRKQGFSSPIQGLLSDKALDSLASQLNDSSERYVRILNKTLFLKLIGEHRAGREDHSLQIFTLMIYLKWMQHCYEGFGTQVDRYAHAATGVNRHLGGATIDRNP